VAAYFMASYALPPPPQVPTSASSPAPAPTSTSPEIAGYGGPGSPLPLPPPSSSLLIRGRTASDRTTSPNHQTSPRPGGEARSPAGYWSDMFVSNGDMPPAMAYVGLAALEQPGSRATECKVAPGEGTRRQPPGEGARRLLPWRLTRWHPGRAAVAAPGSPARARMCTCGESSASCGRSRSCSIFLDSQDSQTLLSSGERWRIIAMRMW